MAHSRSTSVTMTDDSNAPVPNGQHGAPNGMPSTNGGSRGGKRHYPHIDDLTRVAIDIDPRTPINTLYTLADRHMKMARSSKTFNRVDIALKEYVTGLAYLTTLSRHTGFEFLKVDNSHLWEKVSVLLKQHKAEHAEFEHIKDVIKADNAITGVQPSWHRSGTGGTLEPNVSATGSKEVREDGLTNGSETKENGTLHSGDAPQAIKTKPVIQPKPQALHGNAIGSVYGAGASAKTISPELAAKATELLRSRLAELRLPNVQDPRIKTRPILAKQLPDSKNGQNIRRPSLAADGDVLGLPKMPDAIYNPARGTVSSEASKLPSSTTGRFSRTRSIQSPATTSAPFRTPPSDGTGSPRYAIDSNMGSVGPTRRTRTTNSDADVEIPSGDCLSVRDLRKLLDEKKAKVLLIDIRHREKFDIYHIESPATICVEPEVLMRPSLSAAQIADSMVLSPPSEQLHFERRDEFDIIVFYDQSSQRISWSKNTYGDKLVMGLYEALVYFDGTDNDNAKRVKLLQGGLDAWITAFGGKGGVPLPQTAAPSVKPWHPGPARRKSSAVMPLQDPAEVNKYNDLLSRSLVRSPEEYLQRRPEKAGGRQESMVDNRGGSPHGAHPPPGLVHHGQPFTGLPPAPKRPAPAAARPSYCGLRDDEEAHSRTLTSRSGRRRRRERKHFVGLLNTRKVWCYANSSLQAMYATRGFADELVDDHWQEDYKVPMKSNEKIHNPQLMSRLISQLFHWMTKGTLDVMEAKVLMDYTRKISATDYNGQLKPANMILGGSAQQDAQEFFSFVTAQIDDETNRHRDRTEDIIAVPDNDARSLLHHSIKYWQKHVTMCDSLVSKYFQGLSVRKGVCPQCRYRTTTIQKFDMLTLKITSAVEGDTTLDALMKEDHKDEIPEGYKCGGCKSTRSGYHFKTYTGRFPDRLAICFARAGDVGSSFAGAPAAEKDNRKITFPFQNLDLSSYFIKPEDRALDGTDPELPNVDSLAQDHHYRSPFVYDCYAVVCHDGSTMNYGHYIAYTRNDSSHDPTDWVEYNDETVRNIKVNGSGSREDWADRIYKNGKAMNAYLVFYERRGT